MTKQSFAWRKHLKVHPAADLFPLMSEEELRALADDLKRTGKLQHSIVLAEDGRLLDGRNRLDALVLIGSLKAGKSGKGLTGLRFTAGEQHQLYCNVQPGDPYEAVLSFNLHRRHLTAEQKREVIDKLLAAQPEKSDRQIAKETKTDHKTVGKRRAAQAANGEIPHKTERTEASGRKARVRKPGKRPAYYDAAVSAETLEQEEIKRKAEQVKEQFQEQARQAGARPAHEFFSEFFNGGGARRGYNEEIHAERDLAVRIIDAGYRALAKVNHPDHGGSKDTMARLSHVRDLLKGLVTGVKS
jgi:hypothetical protein